VTDERPQKPVPEKVTEADVGDPERMISAIVRKATKEHRAAGDVLDALNRHLDAFSAEFLRSDRTGPGGLFLKRAIELLQAEIGKRDVQGKLLPNQVREGA
jgi:hypothetical protein